MMCNNLMNKKFKIIFLLFLISMFIFKELKAEGMGYIEEWFEIGARGNLSSSGYSYPKQSFSFDPFQPFGLYMEGNMTKMGLIFPYLWSGIGTALLSCRSPICNFLPLNFYVILFAKGKKVPYDEDLYLDNLHLYASFSNAEFFNGTSPKFFDIGIGYVMHTKSVIWQAITFKIGYLSIKQNEEEKEFCKRLYVGVSIGVFLGEGWLRGGLDIQENEYTPSPLLRTLFKK